jgi:hypothetical protein
MTKHRDGGPAFPYGQRNVTERFSEGMSLRDYFAAAALSGLLSNKEGYERSYEFASEEAYHYADEMLIARKRYP